VLSLTGARAAQNPAYRLARYFSQSVQPVNSLYFSMTFTAAFLIPKSICVPTAFDGEMR
jgi:hypothetical protein